MFKDKKRTRKVRTKLIPQKGFTLPEVMVSVMIFIGVSAICLALLFAGTSAWKNNKVQVELQGEMRKALDWIKEDLRQSGSSGIADVPADGNWYTSITFQTVTGVINGSATWSASDTIYGLSGTNLRRTANSITRTIATKINTLRFRRQSATSGYLEVNMTAEGTTDTGRVVSITTTADVKLRN